MSALPLRERLLSLAQQVLAGERDIDNFGVDEQIAVAFIVNRMDLLPRRYVVPLEAVDLLPSSWITVALNVRHELTGSGERAQGCASTNHRQRAVELLREAQGDLAAVDFSVEARERSTRNAPPSVIGRMRSIVGRCIDLLTEGAP